MMKKEKMNEFASLAALAGLLMALYLWIGLSLFLYVLIIIAIPALLIPAFRRLCSDAYQWISRLLGSCISFVLLFLFYYGILTPLGLFRKMTGKTALPFRRNFRGTTAFTTAQETMSRDSFEKMW
jgi:hypothetical protein